jgi:hypothetical protein
MSTLTANDIDWIIETIAMFSDGSEEKREKEIVAKLQRMKAELPPPPLGVSVAETIDTEEKN